MTLGFVGLGAMGQNAARRLLEAGHRVQGFDLSAHSLQAFASNGGQVVATPGAVSAGAARSATSSDAGSSFCRKWVLDRGTGIVC